MADDAVAWVRGAVGRWMRRADPTRPFRILSIGCGDGSLDLPMLDEARRHGPVDYVGCDVNAESLAVFTTGLAAFDGLPDVTTTLVHGPFQILEPRAGFDLVLMAHMLYYVDDPVAAVRDALVGHVVTDGRLVVIHSSHEGVPAMVESALGGASFVTAEQVVDGLVASGLAPRSEVLPGRLCIEDAIADSPLGRAVLAFIVERDPLAERDREGLITSMVDRASEIDGERWMPEDLVTIELRARLRPTVHRIERVSVDPVEDYHVLAESFDWLGRLMSLPAVVDGSAPALLDVGCGTGRWLRVLASTFPTLTAGSNRRLVYDRVDPSSGALGPNTEIASTMFEIGSTWCEGVETAPIPTGRYSLIWSVHSLYGLPVEHLAGVLKRLVDALVPDGVLMVVLADPRAFYIEAKPRLVGGEPFTSSRDVLDAAASLGLTAAVRVVTYTESFDVADDDALRRFVWHESIGNSYLPAGLTGDELPALPTGDWWNGHRRGDRFEFDQSVSVIVIERG
jgi:SAM-dependent methyltransferase